MTDASGFWCRVVVVIYEWMNCFIEDFDNDLELQVKQFDWTLCLSTHINFVVFLGESHQVCRVVKARETGG